MTLAAVQDLLPDTVRLMVRLVGLPATLQLVERLGGTTWPVAKGNNRLGQIRHEALAEVVGGDAASVLARHFGGDTLYIPRCAKAVREMRDRSLREEFDQLTRENSALHAVTVLALKYRLADRQIWRILKKPDQSGETRQVPLF